MSPSRLVSVLSSKDADVRRRGITLLSSILTTHPADILDCFPDYLPFFLSLLQNRHMDSIAFCTLSELLFQAISMHINSVKESCVCSLLRYISECVEHGNVVGRMNAFVADLFRPKRMARAFKGLFARGLKSQAELSYILRILAVTEDKSILNIAFDDWERLVLLVKRNEPDVTGVVVRCINSEVRIVADLGIKLAYTVAKESKDFCRQLYSYASQLKSHPLYDQVPTLRQVYEAVTASANYDCPPIPRDMCKISTIASLAAAKDMFGRIDPRADDKLNDSRKPPESSVVQTKPRGFVALLDEGLKIGAEPLLAPASSQSPAARAVYQESVAPVLKSFAEKKGMGLGNAWQKRWLEFYPGNKCLIWRTAEKYDGIKGVLFIDRTCKLEKNGSALVIRTQNKSHQIQFENQKVLEEWHLTMTNCLK
jgi:hypothetical protein